MRRLALVLFVAFFASGLASQVEAQSKQDIGANSVRKPDQILGAPIYGRAAVERYARSVGCTRYVLKAIPIYYGLAQRRGIAPDVLVAQAILETGRGHYGGASRPWNMAGIKKGGPVGDRPRDFEVPPNAREGGEDARQPHDRLYGRETHRRAARALLRGARRPGKPRMVGEEGEPVGERGVGQRPRLRGQDPADTR
jgi:hypothetical protein